VGTFKPGATTPAPKNLEDDKQVREEIRDHNSAFKLLQSLAGSFYFFDQVEGKLKGLSQDEIDLRLLEQAKKYGPRTEGKSPEQMERFNEIMNYFLDGSGRTLYFKMADLLNSCLGAQHRVSEAITFRIARHADLVFGSPSCDKPTQIDYSRGKPVPYSVYQFPIHQGDYQDTDWKFSLGTFGAMWMPLIPKRGIPAGVMCKSDVDDNWIDEGTLALIRNKSPQECFNMSVPRPTQAKVWGTKIWRWHSGTDRVSEAVHKAGYRLVQSGRLKNFWVVAEPCIVDIKTGRPVLDAN
jgi:hypothetical protein